MHALAPTTPVLAPALEGLAEAIFRETGDALILFEPATGAILEVNPTAQRLSGFSRDELLRQQTTWLLQAEGLEPQTQLHEVPLTAGSYRSRDGYVLRSRHHSGFIPVSLTVTRLNLGAQSLGLITAHDIREQREAYSRLKKVEAEMRRVLTSVSDCLWSARLDGAGLYTYRYFSPVVENITGRTPKYFMDRDGPIEELRWRRIVDPRDLARWEQFAARIRAGASSQEEYRVLRPDGRVCWVRESVRVSQSHNHQALVLDGVISDITAHQHAQAELQNAKDIAEAASRAKSEFLAHMSHEIRTPLNGVLGMAELMHKTELNAVQRSYLEVLQSCANALLSIIKDILDFSKIEARMLELETLPFALRETLSAALDVVAVQAQQKQLELTLHVRPDVPDQWLGDPNRLRQVLLNLVNNAVKFTERGAIVVLVENLPVTDAEPIGSAGLHVTVRDTGIGVRPEMHQVIFEAFAQGDPSSTRKYGGTGLGLGIAARLVQHMGGRIWAESAIGRGSTFHFTVHLERGALPEPVVKLEAALLGKRVLVIDDHQANRDLLQELMTAWGLVATTAAASEAAALFCAAGDRQFDFLLCAANEEAAGSAGFEMPWRHWFVHGGYSTPVILLLSAAHLSRHENLCQSLGIAAHVTKPIRESLLLAALRQAAAVADDVGHPVPSVAPTAPARARCRILLVEDNPVNQLFAATVLESQGHQVIVAASAADALQAIERTTFDICLMDIEMPDMDGFAATQALRRLGSERGFYLPIVAVTAHALKGFEERCLDAGMDAYLSKPVRSDDLLEAVARYARPPAPAGGY